MSGGRRTGLARLRAGVLPVSVAVAAGIAAILAAGPSTALDPVGDLAARVDALVAAYPDHLSHRDGNVIVWRDGTRMVIDDGVAKTPQATLDTADVEDMLAAAYPVGPCSYGAPPEGADPGRTRAEDFLRTMYGNSAAAVEANLVAIDWFGTPVRITTINGVDRALAAVRDELAALPAAIAPAFTATAGTFNWRTVAGTSRASVHSFGAAIDLNTAFADYWLWASPTGREDDVPPYRNRMPLEVVDIFERHGFIWGGKWHHFDTMHFEYRPELIALAETAACPGP